MVGRARCFFVARVYSVTAGRDENRSIVMFTAASEAERTRELECSSSAMLKSGLGHVLRADGQVRRQES